MMEPILITQAPIYAAVDCLLEEVQPKSILSAKIPQKEHTLSSKNETTSWGRRAQYGSWLHSLIPASLMVFCPFLVSFYASSLTHFGGSLSEAGRALLEIGCIEFYRLYFPGWSLQVGMYYGLWLGFQFCLYQFLPGKISVGQLTPAGHVLKYRTNGLLAWIFTHVSYVLFVLVFDLDPAIIAKNWGALLCAANAYGFLLTAFVYIKARQNSLHDADRVFSGSLLYDVYMGVELNPRIGEYFDFKLFHNGRPGIIAWTLINASFMAYQHQLHGVITKSMIVSSILQGIYVVDFFINEDWYLRTIDICHDHFGFYLAWGSVVWLPAMYTLQTQYLARNPVVLSSTQATGILVAGIGGYILFRSVNHQKDIARRTKGNCFIWGVPAKVLQVSYRTKDGLEHQTCSSAQDGGVWLVT